MKLYTIDRNPKSKNPFVGGQNPTIPSPIFPQFFTPVMYYQWQGLSTTDCTVSNHVDRLWCLIAQRTLLGGRYTGRGVASTRHVRGAPAPLPTLSLSSSLPFLLPSLHRTMGQIPRSIERILVGTNLRNSHKYGRKNIHDMSYFPTGRYVDSQ